MEEVTIPEKVCSHCNASLEENQKFCTSCGYPEDGTEKEKAVFHADRVMAHSKSKEAPKLIRKARNTLFFIAGITFLYGVVIFFIQDDPATLIAAALMAVIYLILGFWSQQKPLVALVLALLLYVTNIVLSLILDPETIFNGIILKVIIIVFLAKGINSALHLRKSK